MFVSTHGERIALIGVLKISKATYPKAKTSDFFVYCKVEITSSSFDFGQRKDLITSGAR